jgi:hypothetical protein
MPDKCYAQANVCKFGMHYVVFCKISGPKHVWKQKFTPCTGQLIDCRHMKTLGASLREEVANISFQV